MMNHLLLWTIVMTCLSLPTGANAHKVKLFATVEGNTIDGYVYFPGGSRAHNVVVKVTTVDGTSLGETHTDTNGQFSYTMTQQVDHVFSVDTGDGHYTSHTVNVGETSPAIPTTSVATPTLSELIENSVSKQIRPLREQLETYEEKVRFHDILGGIGYIFGLASLWILIKRRS